VKQHEEIASGAATSDQTRGGTVSMSSGPPPSSRRAVLRRAAAMGLLAAPVPAFLGACGADAPKKAAGGSPSVDNPLGVKADAALDLLIFDGGYSDKYATQVHEPLYRAKFPKATIKHETTAEVAKVLQPRFVGGTPPDFVNNSGSGSMDFGALVADRQILELTPLWDAPSVDDPKKRVRETVVPGTVEAGSYNQKPYVLYYVSTVFGIWYSGKLFKEKGWTAPDDWDAFIKLLGDIKSAGITPYAYAGANAAYYQWNVILTQSAKIGGHEILRNIDNLEDGAWKVDAVRQAAQMWAEVGAKFMDRSQEGLTHTDVQLQHNQYRIAFYPSGNWIETEQEKQTPPGFTYQMIPLPGTAGDKLSRSALRSSPGEGYVVPAKAKNPQGGMEYMRQMLSIRGARGFTELAKALTVVKGASDGITLRPGTMSSYAALKAAGNDVINMFFGQYYKALETELRAATNALMFGRINAGAFVERVQKKADEIKKDPSVAKFRR
jgi:N-acetylglucosamine transport system substrate-binding protein